MKIAIVSDLHIGYERFREDAYRQARMALELAASKADAILIPGDIFDKRSPKPDVIAEAINIFRDIGKAADFGSSIESFIGAGHIYTNIPIIAIPGTHERTAAGKENPLTLLSLAGLLADTSESTTIIRKDDERVAVFGLGGVPEEKVKDELVRLSPKPVPGAFNIFMFHQSIYEILPFSEDFIRYEDLPEGFDLYVCGHIHNKIVGKVHGKPFLIPGSTVLTQLKEAETEGKGFIIFDTATSAYEYVRINSRDFIIRTIEVSSAKPDEIMASIREAVESSISNHDNPIVRVVVRGTLDKGSQISDIYIQKLASEFHGKAEVEIDISKLSEEGLEESIVEVREGRLGNMSIKELGMSILKERLKEEGYSGDIDPSFLFSILSESKKDNAIKTIMELLEKRD
ncbi:MAG: DNA repair exonuclease [Candidatus Micrarchaeaceae archaeon]